jgi:hypothetical protein
VIPAEITGFRMAYRAQGDDVTRAGALAHLSQKGTRSVSVHASGSGITACARVYSYLSSPLGIACGHKGLDGATGARLMAIALQEAAMLQEHAAAARAGQAEPSWMADLVEGNELHNI